MRDASDEITSGYTDRVLGDVDVQLIASWMLIDRRLPDGGTPVERYAQRDDLPPGERDVARRMAAARLGLLRVVRVLPGRWVELHDLAIGGGGCARSATMCRGPRVRTTYWSAG